MIEASGEKWTHETITVILLGFTSDKETAYINYYYNQEGRITILRNPEIIDGNLMIGSEISLNLHTPHGSDRIQEAELILTADDFLPDAFCEMLSSQPPAFSTFFGLISEAGEGIGRYYMLRDHNADGLLLCTGTYQVKKGTAYCRHFDGQWKLRYNIVENFFYASDHLISEIKKWKHPSVRLTEIDDNLTIENLNKKFRNNAALWHRFNFFYSDDWSIKFYRRQARLGFIAITYTENGKTRITPQLQREYAVLDWKKLVIAKAVRKILTSGRIKAENISLNISPDPEIALEHLVKMWTPTWITDDYENLIKKLAAECMAKKDRRFRIWGVTLTAGLDGRVIAGELGYSIGRTYTSLSGFFHRGEKKYNNFGKLQMVMLAGVLQRAGIKFWNLGQPYMEYKLKLGAEVVPRGLFLKRWDRAVKGRTPDLSRNQ